MHIDASRAIGGYAAVMTLATVWLALSAVTPPAPAARFATIDVERINVREPDGTLRLAISNHARMPGLIVGAKEYVHPNRPDAGMIFYNDEGIENGGLVFDGRRRNGRPANSGSLTFDRYLQDQTVQVVSTEDGPDRRAGFVVFDRPDGMMDIEAGLRLRAMPDGAEKRALAAKANAGGAQRMWLGSENGTVSLVLKDRAGHPRLTLAVDEQGKASVSSVDAQGRAAELLRPAAR